jgi:hypothetical protein
MDVVKMQKMNEKSKQEFQMTYKNPMQGMNAMLYDFETALMCMGRQKDT